MARIQTRALTTLELSKIKNGQLKRAKRLLPGPLSPIVKKHPTAFKASVRLARLNKTLSRRAADLAASNRSLKRRIIQRKTAEQAFRTTGRHSAKLLRESFHLQRHLRHLVHRVLSAQEAERKKISRELRDEVAQALLGINVRLLTLKKAARGDTANLKKEIANTQRLVEESLQSINRFARELDIHQQA